MTNSLSFMSQFDQPIVAPAVTEPEVFVTDSPELDQLLTMLTYRRPHKGDLWREWVERFILPCGAVERSHGNFVLDVGDAPRVLFSAHVDTVHRADGYQKVIYDDVCSMVYKDDGEPLGADDAAGCWMMLRLIEAGIPGRYIFHVGEEVGCIGSRELAKQHEDADLRPDNDEWVTKVAPCNSSLSQGNSSLPQGNYDLDGIEIAIAFDRKGTDNLITHQMMGRCASDEFGDALAGELNKSGMSYKLDNTGVVTDTASYMEIVSECTNLSVGYESEHTSNEVQDIDHLFSLRDALIAVDWDALPAVRDPAVVEDDPWDRYGAASAAATWEDVYSWVCQNPVDAADLLCDWGVRHEDMKT